MRPKVELTKINLITAGMVGVHRVAEKIHIPKGHAGVNYRETGWQINLDGAVAEAVFAKWLNTFWMGTVGVFRTEPDVAGCEVRSTPWKNGRLIVRPRDSDSSDDTPYVLVITYEAPVFELAGWIRAQDAKQDKYWGAMDPKRPPAWNVPQSDLLPMEQLIAPRMAKG